jgi:hypothetical protein
VNPDLVARDEEGNAYTVRYEAVNAMLLNEFLKDHRAMQELKATAARAESKAQREEATVGQLESIVARQQKQIEALTATVEKVSNRLKLNKAAPRLVATDQ